MLLKKNSIVYILAAIVLIAILAIYFSNNINKLYGNDKESIVKVIKSIEGYEDESIEILEIKDIYDERIVGFLSNNNPANIKFSKNQNGNYEWNYIEKSEGQSFNSFLIHVSKDESNVSKFMVVTNQENNIAKMELGVNKIVIEQDFNVNLKSVTWIDLPETNDGYSTFNYKYYGKDGSLIED